MNLVRMQPEKTQPRTMCGEGEVGHNNKKKSPLGVFAVGHQQHYDFVRHRSISVPVATVHVNPVSGVLYCGIWTLI